MESPRLPGQAEGSTVASALSQLQGALPALQYKRQPFPWRDAGPRLLRRRSEGPNEVLFDCPVRGDVFQVGFVPETSGKSMGSLHA